MDQAVANFGSSNVSVLKSCWGEDLSCYCLHQGDLDRSRFIDVQDVLRVIFIAFVNGNDITDCRCPRSRADVNRSGFVDVSDVLYLIKTAFRNGPNPLNPCVP